MKVIKAEYLWLDGGSTPSLRSKTKVLRVTEEQFTSLTDVVNSGKSPHDLFPMWGFDGSSTMQASGDNSDCILKPVFTTVDPARQMSWLVLCEVFTTDGTPHETNSRALLREALIAADLTSDPRVGFEQEYVIMDSNTHKPIGWPEAGYPAPQGPYYCASGGSRVAGRDLVEGHLNAMISSGISVEGVNAEVMLGQWEYQVGGVLVDVLTASDHLWMARYLLDRLSEKFGYYIELDPKPVSGDWNGSGMHTNFSLASMRAGDEAYDNIVEACDTLGEKINDHLDAYGEGLERRLTGYHETCSINDFRWGVSDRSASVRVPWQVEKNKVGYLEDRRPNSNADPYRVVTALVSTLCPKEEPVEANHVLIEDDKVIRSDGSGLSVGLETGAENS
jgi:glutamine synthetase